MNKKLVNIITLSAALLNIFLLNAAQTENVYNVQATINSADLPTAAKIFAESIKTTQPTADKAVAALVKAFHFDTKDLTESARILAQAASTMQLPPELIELIKETRLKVDSKHFENPTFHLGD
jgi:hypothetical protein